VDKLKYANHDIADRDMFLDFSPQVYMERKGIGLSRDPFLELNQWIGGLYNTSIMNLLEITHFGRGKDVNAFVKQLFSLVYGGVIWMERQTSIDLYLIAEITGFQTD
jgi:hypothetical protein